MLQRAGHDAPPQLVLNLGTQQHLIDSEGGPFVIGRDPQKAHLAVALPQVSRDHCHIVYNRGKFVLSDHSTNGTWVRPEGSDTVYLRREEYPMRGSGVISLGQAPGTDGAPLIIFSCMES